ncbi:M20 family metallopeptidase [uncultured Dysosmobacter sp.]|uniref:M20 metallopeptidase family protein n=1 Tax=uncultured Dysosmobacter sp. TaxID=2591384 RepID=UPI0026150185|nr:amidohydrolase [uncultured Dysosmobacter sp.]
MDTQEIRKLAETYRDYAVEARRWFHSHAELSNQEFQTTEYIIRQLEEMGIPYVTPGNTGAIGIISGIQPGPVLGIRADIDALPIQELSDVPYRSMYDGVMHACGHDAHAASLLGTAQILNQLKDRFHGTVKLIFQPAEEYFPSGALTMMGKGDLDDCDAIIGAHTGGLIPSGKVNVEPGPRMASSASVNIHVKGQGGHGGRPHEAIDAIVVAAAIIMNLQTVVSRELNINNSAVLSIGTLQAGTAKNIIAEDAYMTGTLRYFDPELIKTLEASVQRVASNTAAAYRATAEVEIVPGLPAVINDYALAELAEKTAIDLFGKDNIIPLSKVCGTDDFAYYADKAPILYARIGVMNEEKVQAVPLHNPRFDIDEDYLVQAMEFFSAFALRYNNR